MAGGDENVLIPLHDEDELRGLKGNVHNALALPGVVLANGKFFQIAAHLVEVALASDDHHVVFFKNRVAARDDGLAVSHKFRHDKVEGEI